MTDPIIRAIDDARRLDAADQAAWNAGDNAATYVALSEARSAVAELTPTSLEGARALAIWLADEIRRDGDAAYHMQTAASRLADWARSRECH